MAARGNGAARRWSLVVLAVLVLAALPSLIRALPAADAAVPAPALRERALASAGTSFSGYAESAGGLALPVTDALPDVANLFSERTTMRVWWRSAQDSRVDVVTPGGEKGVHTDAAGRWTWDFAADTATRTPPAALDLPTAPDLLPSSLGRRLLSEATPAELSRTGAVRIAGRDALGLRVVPSDAASSVARVDVAVDRTTGLPLRVRVYGKGVAAPALDTRFLDLSLGRPPASVTAFSTPPGATVRAGTGTDQLLQGAAGRLRPIPLPDTLAGLPRRALAGAPPGVALYGRGITLLAVAPLDRRVAGGLQSTVRLDPTAVTDAFGIRTAAGPIGLQLLDRGFRTYLLTGTVTTDALAQAAQQVEAVRR